MHRTITILAFACCAFATHAQTSADYPAVTVWVDLFQEGYSGFYNVFSIYQEGESGQKPQFHTISVAQENAHDDWLIYYHKSRSLGGGKQTTYKEYDNLRVRMSREKIEIRDITTDAITVGMDFTLGVGDRFTTYDGMEWEVESAGDTVFSNTGLWIDYYTIDQLDYDWEETFDLTPYTYWRTLKSRLKVLRLKSLDGKTRDTWLEGIGSLCYGLHIHPFEAGQACCAKRIETYRCPAKDRYAAYELYLIPHTNSDPFYCGDLNNQLSDESEQWAQGTFTNGTLRLDGRLMSKTGQVNYAAHRIGDAIYIDTENYGTYAVYPPNTSHIADISLTLEGVPEPTSRQYTVYYDGRNVCTVTVTTSIDRISDDNPQLPTLTTPTLYNLQGQKVGEDYKGIVIKNRRKELQK